MVGSLPAIDVAQANNLPIMAKIAGGRETVRISPASARKLDGPPTDIVGVTVKIMRGDRLGVTVYDNGELVPGKPISYTRASRQ